MDSRDGTGLPVGWRSRNNADYVETVVAPATGDWRKYTVKEKYDRMTSESGGNKGSMPVGWDSRLNQMSLDNLLMSKNATAVAVAEVSLKTNANISSTGCCRM